MRGTYSQRRRRSLAFAVAAFAAGASVTLAASLSMDRYREFATNAFSKTASGHGPTLALLATDALQHTREPATKQIQAAEATMRSSPGAIEPALLILPSLRHEGLKLVRGDVEGTPGDPANCLDFADPAGTPIVLCVAAAQAPDVSDFQNLGAVSANAVYWRQGRSLYALASPLRSERLIALAQQIHALLMPQHAH